MSQKTLSFIIPAYNEEKTLEQLVMKVIDFPLHSSFSKEIIIINDCSKDSTQSVIDSLAKRFNQVKPLTNAKNMGKSQTVRAGIVASTGDFVVIQDADLEYDPKEINDLVEYQIANDSDVVYGNRFGKKNKVIYWQNYIGNKFLSCVSNLFTYPRLGVWIPDMEVCYKLIRGDVARELGNGITSLSNFGFEPEITAKLSKYKKADGKHLKLGIVSISYYPRSVAEGKHMKAFRDGMKALNEIIKFNLA
jgi:glycosyltransferase involved in cell wall biosynthesis